jgi:hypothetical protein
LVSALESSGCTVVVSSGSGYRAMNSVPEEALPPIETGRAMIDFLTKASPEKDRGGGYAYLSYPP